MRGVVCAGNIVVDILARPVAAEVRWQASTWIEDLTQALGGNGANTACALAKMGAGVVLAGAVGRDAFGDYALAALQAAGVNTAHVERHRLPTAASAVLVRADGARALLHRPGVSEVALSGALPFPDGCSHLHLANIFALRQFRRLAAGALAEARRRGWTTSLDTGHDALGEWIAVLAPCLPLVDLLFVNEQEAQALTGEPPARAAATLVRHGAATVVLKRGAAGCSLYGAVEAYCPGFDVAVVDTTGAGDCFAGGFLARYLEGAPFEECAVWGNAFGSLNVQTVGATTGLRPRSEVEQWITDEYLRRST